MLLLKPLRIAARLLSVLCCFFIFNISYAADQEEFTLPSHKQEESLSDLMQKAEQGMSEAQVKLGIRYQAGIGVDKDLNKAVELFKAADQQGNVKAKYNLALMYLLGKGVTKDEDKGLELLTAAAKRGYDKACYVLGRMYLSGTKVEIDEAKATEFIQKAADKGNKDALYILGDMYSKGIGVEQDFLMANSCFHFAHKQGHKQAKLRAIELQLEGKVMTNSFKEAYEYLIQAAKNSTRAKYDLGFLHIMQNGGYLDQKKGVELITQAAEKGFGLAQSTLGRMYIEGYIVEKDRDLALIWLKKSAEKECAEGQFYLATLYDSYPEEFETDYEQSLYWYTKAAKNDYLPAYVAIGNMYENGYGVDKDYEKALDYYLKAAQRGNTTGQFEVGRIYREGLIDEPDYEEALTWLQKAANNSNSAAQTMLGDMYYEGQGVEPNYQASLYWFSKAANYHNHNFAQYRLAFMYLRGDGVNKDYNMFLQYIHRSCSNGYSPACEVLNDVIRR